MLDGREFLGYPTRRAKAIYVTEQSRETFTDALRRAGMHLRGEELQLLFRSDLGGVTWPQLVAQTRVDGYDVCVFDTIGKLAGIKNENDAGEWATAMTPLNDLAASGRAVIVDRHDRKSGGEVGDSGRGSSQASGDVDIILALRRPEGNQPSNRRVVEALSRYAQTPDKVVIELTDAGYALLGGDEAVAQSDALSFVCNLLGNKLQTNSFPASSADLLERGKRERGLSAWAVRSALGTLVGRGELVVTGRGVKGDPHVYDRPPEPPSSGPEANSFGTPTPKQTNEFVPHANGAPQPPFAERFARLRTDAWAAFERGGGR